MKSFFAWRGHAVIALFARVYLGIVFLAACAHKIVHPEAFALDIATYQILPLGLVNVSAVVLPWVELAAGLMLVLGLRGRAGALLAAGMMVMFMVALFLALRRHLDISCGCFASQGAQHDPISWKTMARDGAWLALALYVVAFDRRPLGVDWLFARRREARPAEPRLTPDDDAHEVTR